MFIFFFPWMCQWVYHSISESFSWSYDYHSTITLSFLLQDMYRGLLACLSPCSAYIPQFELRRLTWKSPIGSLLVRRLRAKSDINYMRSRVHNIFPSCTKINNKQQHILASNPMITTRKVRIHTAVTPDSRLFWFPLQIWFDGRGHWSWRYPGCHVYCTCTAF